MRIKCLSRESDADIFKYIFCFILFVVVAFFGYAIYLRASSARREPPSPSPSSFFRFVFLFIWLIKSIFLIGRKSTW